MVNEAERLITRRMLSAAFALLMFFGAVLFLERRPLWCDSGLGVWSQAWTHCTSQNLLDPYSFSHFLHGVIFFWLLQPFAGRLPLRWRLIAAIAIEIAWEILENSPWIIARYRQDTAAFDYSGDSVINSLGDVAATIVGFVVASRVSWKSAIAIFIAIELWMLFLARDNLTLNVLMLFHPIEAIKQWQLQAIP